MLRRERGKEGEREGGKDRVGHRVSQGERERQRFFYDTEKKERRERMRDVARKKANREKTHVSLAG